MRHILNLAIKRILLGLMVVAVFLQSGTAFAQEAMNSTASGQGLKIPLFREDQLLNQPRNSVSYWFTLPQGGELSEHCFVSIHFSFSDTLIPEKSRLGITINGVPLETKGIYDLEAEGKGWWSVKLPAAAIQKNASNEIKITSNQRSIEGDCADIDNPDNWVVLHQDSFLYYNVKSYAEPILSQLYPIYYDGLNAQDTLSTDFIIPQKIETFTLSSLLKVSSAIGQSYSGKRILDYSVVQNPEIAGHKNRIYIGLLSDWKDKADLVLPMEGLKSEQGFLSIAPSNEKQPFYRTLITGEDSSGLNKAVDFMDYRTLLEQANQQAITLSSQIPSEPQATPAHESGNYTLADLGYGTIKLAGAFHQKTYLSFVQPQGIQSGKGSYLNLQFSHSKALVSDRSVITVYINGTAVTSTKLTTANAEDGNLKVNIPEKALKSPVINVDIECYNYLGLVDCSKDYSDSAWTVISPESEVVLLPGDVMIQPTLERFPYFYPRSGAAEPEVVLGLSNSTDQAQIELATMFASRLGQNTGTSYQWSMVNGNNLTRDQKTMDMVYIGAYKDIQLPQEVKDALAVFPAINGEIIIQEGVDLIQETLDQKTLFQVIRSPWDPSRRIYVLMYDGESQGALLNQALKDRDVLQTMNGQVGLLDAQLKIHSLNYQEKEVVTTPKTLSNRASDLERITHMPWWMLLGLLTLIVAGLIAMIRLRRVKNEFAQAGKKMKEEQGFTESDPKK